MREIRTSGSEGGVGSIPHSYLYQWGGAPPEPGASRRNDAWGVHQRTAPRSVALPGRTRSVWSAADLLDLLDLLPLSDALAGVEW